MSDENYITEAAARTKWCPHTRMALVDGQSVNRTAVMGADGAGYANIYAETRCIGAGCMMWRWWSDRYGACGLAGRP